MDILGGRGRRLGPETKSKVKRYGVFGWVRSVSAFDAVIPVFDGLRLGTPIL